MAATERVVRRRWWPFGRGPAVVREVVRASTSPGQDPAAPGRKRQTVKTLRSSHLGKVELNTTTHTGGVETTHSLKITRHYANEGY